MEQHTRTRLNDLSLADLNIIKNFLTELLVASETLSKVNYKYKSMIADVNEVMKEKIFYIFDL